MSAGDLPASEAPAGAPPRRAKPSKLPPRPKALDWETVSDEELLETRICDLPIRIEGKLERWIAEVHAELDAKGLSFHPQVYLGDEWFSPEDDPVISIPFYLAHPRLIRLERARMFEAEGDSKHAFFMLLRHELGHALAHAYRLHRRPGYRRMFGDNSAPYPERFHPRPYSRSYVRHLEDWYAQTHPDEDYAETFAVWLTPGSDWRSVYAGWPALKKLQFVDEMMRSVRGRRPLRRTGPKYRRLSAIRMTISAYHKLKRKALEEDFPDFFDRDLRALFAETGREPAAAFLRRSRPLLVRTVSQWTGERRYTVHELVTQFARRCHELRLAVDRPEDTVLAEVSACLTAMAARYFLTGKFKRPR